VPSFTFESSIRIEQCCGIDREIRPREGTKLVAGKQHYRPSALCLGQRFRMLQIGRREHPSRRAGEDLVLEQARRPELRLQLQTGVGLERLYDFSERCAQTPGRVQKHGLGFS
jgi:hypothetical protein